MQNSILSWSRLLMSVTVGLVLATPVFAATASSSQECTFHWSMVSRGFVLGTTRDVVTWSAARMSVTSNFTPSAMASMLGAPRVTRSWSSLGDDVERNETHFKEKGTTKSIQWSTKGDTLIRTSNTAPAQHLTSPEAGAHYVDSTMFPYMALVDSPLASNNTPWVLNDSTPYQATIKKTVNSLQYSASKKLGTVWLNKNIPTKLTFTDGRDSFAATVTSYQCS